MLLADRTWHTQEDPLDDDRFASLLSNSFKALKKTLTATQVVESASKVNWLGVGNVAFVLTMVKSDITLQKQSKLYIHPVSWDTDSPQHKTPAFCRSF